MPRPISFSDPGRFEISCHHSPATAYSEETHPTVQVCVPLAGAAYSVQRHSETGQKLVHHLGARDVLVVPRGQPHAIDWRRPAGVVSLQLSLDFIGQALDLPSVSFCDSFTFRDPFVTATALQFRSALETGQLSSAVAESVAVLVAHRVILGEGSTETRHRFPEKVSRLSARQVSLLERHVEEHLGDPIPLQSLAALVGLSQWHFMRRFQTSFGLSAHRFILQQRLVRARSLLAASNLSIVEVALEVGMNHSHFSRTFLRELGLSPREFRRQQQQ